MLKQICKNLVHRKTRTLLTTAGITVGVAMIVTLGAMGEGLRTGYAAVFSGSGADLVMMQKGSYDIVASAVDQGIVAQVAALPEVSTASGIIVGNLAVPGSPYFIVFGYDPNGIAIQRFKIVEGAALGALPRTAPGNREILLGNKATEALKLKTGDVLQLPGGAFRVVGIYATGSGLEDASAVVPLTDAQQMVQKQREVCAVQVKLKDPRQIEAVRAKLERLYPKLAASQSSEAANQQQLVGIIEGLAWGIALLAVIIGGVGMANTVMMSVFERTREIGTLRALGWSRWRVLLLVLGESVGLSAVGGLLGCAAGAAMIGLMGQSSALAFLQGKITLLLLGQGMSTAVVLGGVGGAYPAWWASRLLPVEALRYEGGAQISNIKFQMSKRGFEIGCLKFDTCRSLWRRRGRTALTVMGVGIGLAAVVALSGVSDGFMDVFESYVKAGDADLMAYQEGISDLGWSALNERLGRQIAAIPGVQNVSGIILSGVTMEETPFLIVMGFDPQEQPIRHFKIVEGRGLTGNREVIMGRPAADLLKVRVGDMVRLGEMNLRLVGLFETGLSYEESGAVVSLRDGQALLGKPRQVTMYAIKVQDPRQAEAIRSQIEARIPAASVVLSSEFAETAPDMQSFSAMALAISALAMIVGGIGMMNTMIMSVFERTREIGTLRALGWRRWRVLTMILKESLVISLIGVVVGLGLAMVLSPLLKSIPLYGSMMSVVISPGLLARVLIVAVGLGAVGGLYPAWRAANLSPAEALRYE